MVVLKSSLMQMRLLLVVLVIAALSPGAAPIAQTPSPRIVEITAERFEFWPSEVIVQEGEEVELRIRSVDTMHGFRIIGAGTNVMIPKRGQGHVAVRFTGSRPGRFTFECSRMCGAGHSFMRGELIVRPIAGAKQ